MRPACCLMAEERTAEAGRIEPGRKENPATTMLR